jgi:hypothetical protein
VLLPGYGAAVPVFLISLFILPFRAYSFTMVFQKLHQAHISNIGAVGELIMACVLMYPLYLWLGLPGLALSFIISTTLQAGYYVFHISKLLNVPAWQLFPLLNWAIKAIIFVILFKLFHSFVISHYDPKWSLIAGAGVMAAVVLITLFTELITDKDITHAKRQAVQEY